MQITQKEESKLIPDVCHRDTCSCSPEGALVLGKHGDALWEVLQHHTTVFGHFPLLNRLFYALFRQQPTRYSTVFYEMYSLFSKATFGKQPVYILGIPWSEICYLWGQRFMKIQGACRMWNHKAIKGAVSRVSAPKTWD